MQTMVRVPTLSWVPTTFRVRTLPTLVRVTTIFRDIVQCADTLPGVQAGPGDVKVPGAKTILGADKVPGSDTLPGTPAILAFRPFFTVFAPSGNLFGQHTDTVPAVFRAIQAGLGNPPDSFGALFKPFGNCGALSGTVRTPFQHRPATQGSDTLVTHVRQQGPLGALPTFAWLEKTFQKIS